MIFSVLLIMGLALLLQSVPADPSQPATWMQEPGRRDTVRLALNLFPFAGIAFLWFMGVLRNRLGAREDRFLATVFLCSGILFVFCLFSAAAISGGLLEAVADGHLLPESEVCYFGRRAVYTLLTVFAFKMVLATKFGRRSVGPGGALPTQVAGPDGEVQAVGAGER